LLFGVAYLWLLATFSPLDADTFQQHAGRFIVGVLRHQLAGESDFEKVFALGGGLLEAELIFGNLSVC